MIFRDFVYWSIVMVVIGVIFSFMFTMPQTEYGSEIDFTVGKADYIDISGAEMVNVTVESYSYFVIASGDTMIFDQESDDDGVFTATGTLSTRDWQILDGSNVSVHISPVGDGHILKMDKAYSDDTIQGINYVVWVVVFVIWMLVIIYAS